MAIGDGAAGDGRRSIRLGFTFGASGTLRIASVAFDYIFYKER